MFTTVFGLSIPIRMCGQTINPDYELISLAQDGRIVVKVFSRWRKKGHASITSVSAL